MKRQRAIAIISFMLVLVMLFSFDGAYNLEARFWEFYNCQIYSYIITVSN